MTIPPGNFTTGPSDPVPTPPAGPPEPGIRLSRAVLWRGGIILVALVLVIAGVWGSRHLAGVNEKGTVTSAYAKRVSGDLRDATHDLTVTTPTPTPLPTYHDAPHDDATKNRPTPTPEETLHHGDSNVELVKKSLHMELRVVGKPYEEYVKSVAEDPAGTVTVTMAKGVSGGTKEGYSVLADILSLDVLLFTTTLEKVVVVSNDGAVRGESVGG